MVVIRLMGCAARRKPGRAPYRNAPIALEQLEDRCTPSAGPPSAGPPTPLGPPVGITLAPTYVILNHHPSISPDSGPGSQYGYTPSQMLQAYGFNDVSFQNNGTSTPGNGSGQTIVIVDAYDDPNIASDLAAFDQAFSLPAPPSFTKIGINAQGQGSSSTVPSPNPDWAVEISLDVEWSHAIAPDANIVLVEANSASFQDLVNAVQYAGTYPGASVVSMSWGGPEFSGESQYDYLFTTPSGDTGGITFVASSGDNGAGVIWPSASSHVVAAGGTTLNLDSSGNYLSESGWSGSGGGISSYVAQPAYQDNLKIYSGDPPAKGMRAVPDVAYDADPDTGVPVYVTYGNSGWLEIGGTSAASPQWAALFAITDQGRALDGLPSLDGYTQTLPALYQASASDFHSITTGSNGYPAGPGFNLVTGLGSPVANRLIPALGAPLAPQVLTTVVITPPNPTIGDGGQEQFTAVGYDQFGDPMAPQPSFSWQLTAGLGSLGTGGLYTAPTTGSGSATVQVTATEGGVTVYGTTTVSYTPGPAISGLTASPNPVTTTQTGLSAQLSDPSGGNLTYTWSVLTAPSGASVSFAPPSGSMAPGTLSTTATFSAAGSYQLQLTVTDALKISVSSSVLVTVDQTFTTIAVSPSNASVQDGGQAQFTATADDQFGNPLASQPSFAWSVLSGGQGTITSTGLYTAPASGSGTDTIQATATVGGTTLNGTATASYNRGLTVTQMSASPNPVGVGDATMLSALITDLHGFFVTYVWSVVQGPAGAPAPLLPSSGMWIVGTFAGSATFFAPGAYVLQLQVTDNLGQTASNTLTVNVTGQGPTITGLQASPSPVMTGNTTTLSCTLSDSSSSTLNYTWKTVTVPTGAPAPQVAPPMGTTSPGPLSATVTFYAPGAYTFELDVTDGYGQKTSAQVTVNVDSQGLTISSLGSNPSPVYGATGKLVAQVSDSFYSSVSYTWTVLTVPSGASQPTLSTSTGTAPVSSPLTTTVTYYAPGSYTFKLAVTDGSGQTVYGMVTVTVDAATPTIGLTANPGTVTGTTTALTGTVTDANEQSPQFQYTWSVTSAPSSMQLPTFTNPKTGTATSDSITNTATFYAAGTYQFQLTITDSWNATTSATVTVTVNQTLTTVTVTPSTATVAQGATQQFGALAYDQFGQLLSTQPSFNWLVASGPGSVSSAGLYTAPTSSTGTAVVKAIATVGSVSVSGSATVTVSGKAPVISNISASPSTVTGTTTTLSVTATDPSGGKLSYAWSVVSQPTGAPTPSFSAGTAASTRATFYAAGSYTFRVVVTSSVSGAQTSATVSVTVAQTLTRVTLSPALVSLNDGASQQFTAYAYDQFLNPMTTTFTWSKASGGGTLTSSGLYTAPSSGTGKTSIKATATVNGITVSGTATILYS